MKSFLYFFLAILFLHFFNNAAAQNSVRELRPESVKAPYTGKIIDSYIFQDLSGEHLFLITKIKDTVKYKTKLNAQQFTVMNDQYTKDWEISDSAEDILLYYTYTSIIDIDSDGLYESVFIYQLNPNGENGSDWKLIIHYKNDQLILRAHIPLLDYDKYSMQLDKSFETAPVKIKEFALDYWKKVVQEQDLKTE